MRFLALIIIFVTSLLADEVVIDSILRVYDGDTFYVNLVDVPDIFGKNIGIRLKGIDAPEMRNSDACNLHLAKISKSYLETRLRKANKIVLRSLSRDKYFRLVAVVYVDGSNINAEMLSKGLANPYTGKGPKKIFKCN
jgi:micrococcal nuclease